MWFNTNSIKGKTSSVDWASGWDLETEVAVSFTTDCGLPAPAGSCFLPHMRIALAQLWSPSVALGSQLEHQLLCCRRSLASNPGSVAYNSACTDSMGVDPEGDLMLLALTSQSQCSLEHTILPVCRWCLYMAHLRHLIYARGISDMLEGKVD